MMFIGESNTNIGLSNQSNFFKNIFYITKPNKNKMK